MLHAFDLQTVGSKRVKKPLMPRDSISVYTKSRE